MSNLLVCTLLAQRARPPAAMGKRVHFVKKNRRLIGRVVVLSSLLLVPLIPALPSSAESSPTPATVDDGDSADPISRAISFRMAAGLKADRDYVEQVEQTTSNVNRDFGVG